MPRLRNSTDLWKIESLSVRLHSRNVSPKYRIKYQKYSLQIIHVPLSRNNQRPSQLISSCQPRNGRHADIVVAGGVFEDRSLGPLAWASACCAVLSFGTQSICWPSLHS
jgi:hypothetical protein